MQTRILDIVQQNFKYYCLLITLAVITFSYTQTTLERKALDPTNPTYLVKMDAIEYYGYLPAFIIYHDGGFGFLDKPFPPGYISNFWVKPHPTKRYTTRMTLGYAIMVSPGFIAGHLLAKATGAVQDGFTTPYLFGVWVWTLFLLIVAFFLIYKSMGIFHVNEYLRCATLLLLALGTNLLNYATFEACMTHSVNFFLCSLLLYASLKWYQTFRWKYAGFIGFSLGFITLIRPTDFILILIPICLGITQFSDFKNRLQQWRNHYRHVLLAIGVGAIPFIIQLIYWKWATGHFLYYGYEGEKFFFNHWLLPEYLFSYRKGWLLYTPIMLFALAGIFNKILRRNGYSWPVFLVILITVWLHSCWWCWWFGGSFGARSMIDFYPLLALPLAISLQYISQLKTGLRLVFICIIFFFCKLNLNQTGQYQGGLLHWDSMTKKAYWAIFFKSNPPKDFDKMLSPTDAEKAKKGEVFR